MSSFNELIDNVASRAGKLSTLNCNELSELLPGSEKQDDFINRKLREWKQNLIHDIICLEFQLEPDQVYVFKSEPNKKEK